MPKRLLTQAEYARHRGVSRVAVLKAVRENRIPTIGGRGELIDPIAADKAWTENTDPSKPSSTNAGDANGNGNHHAEYMRARAHRERVRAIREQLELDKLRGRLRDVEEIRAEAFDAARRIREPLLQLQAKLEAIVTPFDPGGEIRRQVRTTVREVLEDLARPPAPPAAEASPAKRRRA